MDWRNVYEVILASEECKQVACSNVQVLDIEQFSFNVVILYQTFCIVVRIHYKENTFSSEVRFT